LEVCRDSIAAPVAEASHGGKLRCRWLLAVASAWGQLTVFTRHRVIGACTTMAYNFVP